MITSLFSIELINVSYEYVYDYLGNILSYAGYIPELTEEEKKSIKGKDKIKNKLYLYTYKDREHPYYMVSEDLPKYDEPFIKTYTLKEFLEKCVLKIGYKYNKDLFYFCICYNCRKIIENQDDISVRALEYKMYDDIEKGIYPILNKEILSSYRIYNINDRTPVAIIKKLKFIGYDKPTRTYYSEIEDKVKDPIIDESISQFEFYLSDLEEGEYLNPDLDDIIFWLQEKKKIYMTILPCLDHIKDSHKCHCYKLESDGLKLIFNFNMIASYRRCYGYIIDEITEYLCYEKISNKDEEKKISK